MIKYQKWIARKDLQANPECFYVFGDNVARAGMGGQAKEMRGEPNAIGLRVKKYPSMKDDAFFNDEDFFENRRMIDQDIATIQAFLRDGRTVVFPADGIGVDRAQLKKRAPKTWSYFRSALLSVMKQYTDKSSYA